MALKWDESNMAVTKSDLAKAEADAGGVRLDFGAAVSRHDGDANDVKLQRRVLLDPEAATNLLKLLNNLISRRNSNLP